MSAYSYRVATEQSTLQPVQMMATPSSTETKRPTATEQPICILRPTSTVMKCVLKVLELEKAVGHKKADQDSLETLLSLVSSPAHEPKFDSFCHELTGHICESLSTFKSLQPQHARERALSEFHAARMITLPAMWKKLLTDVNCTTLSVMQQQSVNREVFNTYFVKEYGSSRDLEPRNRTSLSAEEDNAIRYVSGYVATKLIRKYSRIDSEKAAQFIECLTSMGKIVHDTASLKFTSEWIRSIDRGGLLHVNDSAFQFFRAIEIRIQWSLPQHLINTTSNKDSLIKAVMDDEDIQFHWCMISTDIVDQEDSLQLLMDVVKLCVTTRGFAVTSMWLEEYKKAKNKDVKKSKSLREELKKQ